MEAQNRDPVISQLKKWKQGNNTEPPGELVSESIFKPFKQVWGALHLRDGVLCLKSQDYVTDETMWRGVVPEELVNEILTFMHNDKTAGHLGIEKLTGKIRVRFYWPGWQRAIKQWCKTCEACAAYKIKGPSPRAPMTSSVKDRPFERIALDMGPFPCTVTSWL